MIYQVYLYYTKFTKMVVSPPLGKESNASSNCRDRNGHSLSNSPRIRFLHLHIRLLLLFLCVLLLLHVLLPLLLHGRNEDGVDDVDDPVVRDDVRLDNLGAVHGDAVVRPM